MHADVKQRGHHDIDLIHVQWFNNSLCFIIQQHSILFIAFLYGTLEVTRLEISTSEG